MSMAGTIPGEASGEAGLGAFRNSSARFHGGAVPFSLQNQGRRYGQAVDGFGRPVGLRDVEQGDDRKWGQGLGDMAGMIPGLGGQTAENETAKLRAMADGGRTSEAWQLLAMLRARDSTPENQPIYDMTDAYIGSRDPGAAQRRNETLAREQSLQQRNINYANSGQLQRDAEAETLAYRLAKANPALYGAYGDKWGGETLVGGAENAAKAGTWLGRFAKAVPVVAGLAAGAGVVYTARQFRTNWALSGALGATTAIGAGYGVKRVMS